MPSKRTRLKIPNSGLEVWLYDDAHRTAIRRPTAKDKGFGGMPPQVEKHMRAGRLVGYSLAQDDDLDLEITVGPTPSAKKLSAARWLDPQTAFLRLPSGQLCVESNDASRLGPEPPGEKGATLKVPAGNYRLTLYRIDYEAMRRESLEWEGPQELIVLTPGGSTADAADGLLPFQERRDTDWIGKYTVSAGRAEALVWLADGWDTFSLNLDAAAVAALGLTPGRFFRTTIPAAGITLLSVYATSWDDGRRLPPPADLPLDEYGPAALNRMADWGGAEVLFCRREKSKTRIADQHQTAWLPATVEVLESPARPATGRGFSLAPLTDPGYSSSFLAMVLSELLPEFAELDQLPLEQAMEALDKKLGALGLLSRGDLAWQETAQLSSRRMGGRVYAGLPHIFALVQVSEGEFELLFLTEMQDRSWVLTGLADEIERRIKRKGPTGRFEPNPLIRFESLDDAVPEILAAHRKAVQEHRQRAADAPSSLEECLAALERFFAVAFA